MILQTLKFLGLGLATLIPVELVAAFVSVGIAELFSAGAIVVFIIGGILTFFLSAGVSVKIFDKLPISIGLGDSLPRAVKRSAGYPAALPELAIFLAAGIAFAIVVINNSDALFVYPDGNDPVSQRADKLSWSALLLFAAIHHLVYVLLLQSYFSDATCPKCKKMFCYVKTGTSGHKEYDTEKTKHRRGRYQVGSVEIDGKEVGGVYQNYHEEDKYVTRHRVWKTHYRCENCGFETFRGNHETDDPKLK